MALARLAAGAAGVVLGTEAVRRAAVASVVRDRGPGAPWLAGGDEVRELHP